MNNLKKKKHGFTIVELVIVIAVIGILSAILIPTFAGLINKAKISSDQTLVKNLNTSLAISTELEGRKPTMHETLESVKDNGFIVEKLTPTSTGSEIVWDSKNNQFVLLTNKDGKTTYFTGTQNDNNVPEQRNLLWKIYTDASKAQAETTYSVYLAGEGVTGEVSVTGVGIDVGNNTGITKVTYNGSTSGTSVVVRTNGNMCELVVDAQNDHVDHYGYSMTTKVIAVNNENSYHEYGTSNVLEVTSGKVVIENTGIVFDLKKSENASENINIINNGGNIMNSSIDEVEKSTAFEINNLAQLKAFRDATNSGETFSGKIINLNCDIVLNQAWKPISNYSRNDADNLQFAFAGEFNGNGHKISGLTNVGLLPSEINTGRNNSTPTEGSETVYGFFASVNGANIHDLIFEDVNIKNSAFGTLLGDSIGALAGYSYGNTKVSGITVNGTIEGFEAVAGIIGRDKGVSLKIENCTNNASIFAYCGAAGIVGRVYGTYTEESYIKSCTNNGTVTSDFRESPVTIKNYDTCYACGITRLRNGNKEFKFVIDDCTNNNSIIYNKQESKIGDKTGYPTNHSAEIATNEPNLTIGENNKTTENSKLVEIA